MINIEECKNSQKYQVITAARLPQEPGAGRSNPTPNHVATR